MAPRGSRRAADDDDGPQAFHELGVRGRKTGLVLRDTGERDEFGMQPLEDLSSPEPAATNGRDPSTDDDDSGSDAMDLETSIGPGPRTVLKERHSLQMPIPRSRSPIKTTLNSPARRNPHLERVSSPTRGSTMEDVEPMVTRKLDFGNSQGRGKGKGKANGVARSRRVEEEDEDEDEGADDTQDTVVRHPETDDNEDLLNESLQLLEDMGGDTPEPEPEVPQFEEEEEEEEMEEEEEEPPIIQKVVAKKGGRGRPPKAPSKPPAEDPPEEPSTIEKSAPAKGSGRRGRPAKKDVKQKAPEPDPEPAKSSNKRTSEGISLAGYSMGSEEEDNDEPEEPAPKSKKQKTTQKKSPKPPAPAKPAAAKAAAKAPVKALAKAPANAPAKAPTKAAAKAATPKAESKPRGRPGRKPKASAAEGGGEGDVGDTSLAAIQRGPPMPKARGLMSMRRDEDVMKTTRSGRQSYRPLDWWRGEEVVREDEEMQDMFGKERFNLPTIKEVKRVPQELPPSSKRGPRSKGRPKSTAQRVQPVQELEDWEVDPGTISGEVMVWEPEYEHQPPAHDEPHDFTEERVAVSSEGIDTRDTRDATFRFAKTLTTPFMGAGVVDLPPGAEKRPKNSRKMHMVFFVHYGKVHVTVNDTQFRISAGGMWFVPRGNYYSITNDYDNPCRIFFSQACEISAGQAFDPDMSQNSTMALG